MIDRIHPCPVHVQEIAEEDVRAREEGWLEALEEDRSDPGIQITLLEGVGNMKHKIE